MYILILLGLLPYGLGWLTNWIVMTFPTVTAPFFLIGLLTLALWFALAFWVCPKLASQKETLVLLNLAGGVDLLLVLIQEWILGAYWPNVLGALTQFYFLPLLNIGFTLSRSVSGAYITSFLLMLLATFLGCRMRKAKQ